MCEIIQPGLIEVDEETGAIDMSQSVRFGETDPHRDMEFELIQPGFGIGLNQRV
jgi:hypothetical protein